VSIQLVPALSSPSIPTPTMSPATSWTFIVAFRPHVEIRACIPDPDSFGTRSMTRLPSNTVLWCICVVCQDFTR